MHRFDRPASIRLWLALAVLSLICCSPPEAATSDESAVDDGGNRSAGDAGELVCEAPLAEDAEPLLRGQFAPPPDAPTAPPGTIAYLRYDNSLATRTEIRLVREDGSDDRVLYRVSDSVDLWYRPWDLSWRPNGQELAFTSGHLDSFFVRDVYAITVDGKNLRRITNPPLPHALAAYPQGRVRFTAQPAESASAEYGLYVQGMVRAQTWLDPGRYGQWRVPVVVADFGDQRQRAVLRNYTHPGDSIQPWCAYNEPGTMVDVQTCEEVEVESRLPRLMWSSSSQPCLYAGQPFWTRNGEELLYLIPKLGYQANYQLVRTESEPLSPGNLGRPANKVAPYLSVPHEDLVFATLDPTQNAHLLLTFKQAGGRVQQLYRVSVDDPREAVDLTPLICAGRMFLGYCAIGGVAYRQDGSGFFYVSRHSAGPLPPPCGGPCWDLRYYDFATGAITKVADLDHSLIVGLSVSPDERRFLVYVVGDSPSVRDLWMYDRDTGEGALFREGAAYGVWAPSNASAGPPPSRTEESEDAPGAGAPFLWRIEGPTPAYLFATMPFRDPRLLPLAPEVSRALDDAKVVHTEIDFGPEEMQRLRQALILPDEETLGSVLPPPLYARLARYLDAHGSTIADFHKAKPWVVSERITWLQDARGEMIPAEYFFKKAKQAGKETGALALIKDLVPVLESERRDDDITRLRERLDFLEESERTGPNPREQLVRAYLSGDADEMYGIFRIVYSGTSEASRRFMNRMIDGRNRSLTEKIRQILQRRSEDVHFFAVPAANLIGPEGIIELLRRGGYEVRGLVPVPPIPENDELLRVDLRGEWIPRPVSASY